MPKKKPIVPGLLKSWAKEEADKIRKKPVKRMPNGDRKK